jgi:hypothetical protein
MSVTSRWKAFHLHKNNDRSSLSSSPCCHLNATRAEEPIAADRWQPRNGSKGSPTCFFSLCQTEPNGKLAAAVDCKEDDTVWFLTVNDRDANCLVVSLHAHCHEMDKDGKESPAQVNLVAFATDRQNLLASGATMATFFCGMLESSRR